MSAVAEGEAPGEGASPFSVIDDGAGRATASRCSSHGALAKLGGDRDVSVRNLLVGRVFASCSYSKANAGPTIIDLFVNSLRPLCDAWGTPTVVAFDQDSWSR